MARPGAWDRPEALTPLLKEKSGLTALVERFDGLGKAKGDMDDWLAMAREEQTSEEIGRASCRERV